MFVANSPPFESSKSINRSLIVSAVDRGSIAPSMLNVISCCWPSASSSGSVVTGSPMMSPGPAPSPGTTGAEAPWLAGPPANALRAAPIATRAAPAAIAPKPLKLSSDAFNAWIALPDPMMNVPSWIAKSPIMLSAVFANAEKAFPPWTSAVAIDCIPALIKLVRLFLIMLPTLIADVLTCSSVAFAWSASCCCNGAACSTASC